MNPISIVTGAITHPVRTAGSLTQHAYGVAATGVGTTLRLIDRAVSHGRSATEPDRAGDPARVAAEGAFARGDVQEAVVPPAEEPAKKAPARKAPAKKAPAKKTPGGKSRARKAPSARAATVAPALAPEMIQQLEDEAVDADGPTTPSGIPAADVAYNPDTTDTDLHQPGTPPIMDPGTVNAVLSESETLRKAADRDKG